jgi:hypothetical protein
VRRELESQNEVRDRSLLLSQSEYERSAKEAKESRLQLGELETNFSNYRREM